VSAVPVAMQVILGLLGLTALGAVVWVSVRSSYSDAQLKRLRGEGEDYLRRLNYVEPRLATMEKQNELLMALHNPKAFQDRTDVSLARIQKVLDEQAQTLGDVRRAMHAPHEDTP
jgi:hypothetical protein